MTERVVVDIETLGVQVTAPIIQIGVAQVGGGRPPKTWDIRIESALEVGEIEPDTIEWWLGIGGIKRGRLVTLGHALEQLEEWFRPGAPTDCRPRYEGEVWCHSSFDEPILRRAAGELDARLPWTFHQVRDCRTIQHLDPLPNDAYVAFDRDDLQPHHAGDDAYVQAARVEAFVARLGL